MPGAGCRIGQLAGAGGFRLEGELDLSTAPRLGDRLRDVVAAGGPILVDLSALEFMDSTGIQVLIEAARAIEARGWCLYVHVDGGMVASVLELVGLDSI